MEQPIDLNKNPWGLEPGEVITTEAFTGVYRIDSITEKDGYLQAKLNQVYTLEGRRTDKLNRPAYCDIKQCKPAYLQVPMLKKRAEEFMELVNFLNKERKIKGI